MRYHVPDSIGDYEKMHDEAAAAAYAKFGAEMALLRDLGRELSLSGEAIVEREYLRLDRDYWKDKYLELLSGSIRHGEEMAANMVMLAMGKVAGPRQPEEQL